MNEKEVIILEKLEIFFRKVEQALNRPPDRSDGMALYYLFHITVALKTGEASVAGVIKNWLEENRQKLEEQRRQLEDLEHIHTDFYEKHITRIDSHLENLLNPAGNPEKPSGTQLDTYLDFVIDRF